MVEESASEVGEHDAQGLGSAVETQGEKTVPSDNQATGSLGEESVVTSPLSDGLIFVREENGEATSEDQDCAGEIITVDEAAQETGEHDPQDLLDSVAETDTHSAEAVTCKEPTVAGDGVQETVTLEKLGSDVVEYHTQDHSSVEEAKNMGNGAEVVGERVPVYEGCAQTEVPKKGIVPVA